MSNTEENLNNFDETVEEIINEKEDTSEVESNNKDDSNIKNIDKDDVEENDSQLEDLIKERDELKDKLMRALAESENIRKRSFKDRRPINLSSLSTTYIECTRLTFSAWVLIFLRQPATVHVS